MDDVLLVIFTFGLVFAIPGLIWYFIIRKVVRGRRAARAVRTLGATLTKEQAEEFDRVLLPQARNIFQQVELMVEYVRKIDEAENKEADFEPADGREDEELKLTRRQKRDVAIIGAGITASTESYEAAKARLPGINEALEALMDASDSASFKSALADAQAVEEYYRAGLYRIAWVNRSAESIIRIASIHFRESLEQAKSRVGAVESELRAELGTSWVVWAVTRGRTSADAGSVITNLFSRVGLEEDTTETAAEFDAVAGTAVSPSNAETNEEGSIVQQLERLASLFQQDLITEVEYQKAKSKLIDG